ncbi:SDR family NAD(P)-dependent oxidoreductase [Saccharothrix sp. CB00851]|uniref:SDR family NAD(P)-dependent oxidoreductase n=1 Tax=Saccharothrix sp. CB00851 TaxID=1835005 RepID=UPI00093D2BC3|nr:SDR family oxidoreductase [Saccharothrix sp. CB00851]OKI29927.1 3-oxoacyl-ACP reductase [Saccharothrix sp. CB00851]
MLLDGKVAVVTGGARGLGRHITARFVAEGAQVVCAGRDALVAKSAFGDVDRVVFHPVDVRDEDSVDALFSFVRGEYGRLDVLVANAGVSRPGPVTELSTQSWAEVFETNLTGVFLCLRAAAGLLGPGGRIITLSSVLGANAVAGGSAYCASKAAVEMLTKVSALELAEAGITVNCLSPGFIDEGMGKNLAANEAVWSKFRPKLAGGRMGTAAEIAEAAVFLASSRSSYVNGHVLEVNGGIRW